MTLPRLVFVLLTVWSLPLLARCPVPDHRVAIPPPAHGEISVATFNAWRLRDTHKDARYDDPLTKSVMNARLDALAGYFDEVLRYPHLLALEEVENRALLEDIASRIRARGGPDYHVVMGRGHDPSGINVAVMYRKPVTIGETSNLFAGNGRHWLFSRPPLSVQVKTPFAFRFVAVHLRSGHDLGREARVAQKRAAQSKKLRGWMMAQLSSGEPLLVAGDFNSAPGSDAYGEPWRVLSASPFRTARSLLPPDQRFTYIHQCKRQMIDHMLFNARLANHVESAAVSRGNAGHYHRLYGRKGTGEVVSDHDALVLYLRK